MIEEKKTFPTLQEAFGFIERYFKRYNPHGYDTDAKISFGYDGVNVRITRLESCD